MIENVIKTKALLLDLDGTVYIEDELIGDVKNTLQVLRNKGIKIVYTSNNSSKTEEEYKEKLSRLGLFSEKDFIYTSLNATCDYLINNFPEKTVFPVATEKVKEYISSCGIAIKEDADIVLLTFDKELTYKKLETADRLIKKGRLYIATHPDILCPAKDFYIPDIGSFIQLLKTSSKKTPDIIVGKPFGIMAEMLSCKLGIEKRFMTVVGDRLKTDIAFGVNNGLNSVLVLSGETTLKSAKRSLIKPDLCLKDINQLKNYL